MTSLMSFEDYRKRAHEIDSKHNDDWESEDHLADLFKLYEEYGNGVCADQQSGPVPGVAASGDGGGEQDHSEGP